MLTSILSSELSFKKKNKKKKNLRNGLFCDVVLACIKAALMVGISFFAISFCQ